METVVFACEHNAGRSQMAAAYFNKMANNKIAHAISAGNKTASIHPVIARVMIEVGIDLSKARPQLLTPQWAGRAQVLVTMGCGERCPFVPGLEIVDWQIPDPKGQPLERVREIRNEILERVKMLLQCCASPPAPESSFKLVIHCGAPAASRHTVAPQQARGVRFPAFSSEAFTYAWT